eukprot:199570-Rhodomonas_salina.1
MQVAWTLQQGGGGRSQGVREGESCERERARERESHAMGGEGWDRWKEALGLGARARGLTCAATRAIMMEHARRTSCHPLLPTSASYSAVYREV